MKYMRNGWLASGTTLLLCFSFSACFTTGTGTAPAFSKEWTREIERHESEHEPPPEGIPLTDEDAAVKAKIAVDEEGKPRLRLGEGKVSADVDVDQSDAGVTFKYKGSWQSKQRPRDK